MSSDLLSSLRLGTNSPNKIIAVKEINHCDSSFIVSSFLGHWIKHKNVVIIISTHNSLRHYQLVGLKMNYNLQKYVDAGTVLFYNLGEEVVSGLMSNEQNTLQNHFMKLQQMIEKLQEISSVTNIVFDGISHLFDLNFSLNDVNSFSNNIIKLSRTIENSCVLFHCNISSEDDVTYLMANLLSHKANTVMEIENLPSGLSADVSGHLIIRYPGMKFEDEHMFTLEQRSVKYLFKLFDRGVKLFAPGTV
ncbi:elongator complex protein 6-like [Ostrinia furnacalis]|uniref:elongator complex protein 6-like n=1 Tax=Ostrinia furnacalis TaxID=93504 RepID=UPI00103B6E73|nr:elongator complex protein 6-like [Ostrinia furnacalis]